MRRSLKDLHKCTHWIRKTKRVKRRCLYNLSSRSSRVFFFSFAYVFAKYRPRKSEPGENMNAQFDSIWRPRLIGTSLYEFCWAVHCIQYFSARKSAVVLFNSRPTLFFVYKTEFYAKRRGHANVHSVRRKLGPWLYIALSLTRVFAFKPHDLLWCWPPNPGR